MLTNYSKFGYVITEREINGHYYSALLNEEGNVIVPASYGVSGFRIIKDSGELPLFIQGGTSTYKDGVGVQCIFNMEGNLLLPDYYPLTYDAQKHLCNDNNLPSSIVLDGGNGLHVSDYYSCFYINNGKVCYNNINHMIFRKGRICIDGSWYSASELDDDGYLDIVFLNEGAIMGGPLYTYTSSNDSYLEFSGSVERYHYDKDTKELISRDLDIETSWRYVDISEQLKFKQLKILRDNNKKDIVSNI